MTDNKLTDFCGVPCKFMEDKINRLQAENERLKENLNIELENYATEYDNKIKAEAYQEFAETGALAALQFGIDAIRQFIKTKTDLDPVFAFNPSEDELNKMGRYAFEMFENIAKELVGDK